MARNPHGKRRPIGEHRSGGSTRPKRRLPEPQMAVTSNRERIVIRGKTDDDPGRRAIVPSSRSAYSPQPGEPVGRPGPKRRRRVPADPQAKARQR